MILSIAEYIGEKASKALDEIYNYRKDKEELVSMQNMMIHDLNKNIKEWVKKQLIEEKRLEGLFILSKKEHKKLHKLL